MTATHDDLNPPPAELPHPDIVRDIDLSKLTGLPDDELVICLVVLMAYGNGIVKPVVTTA